MAKKIGVRTPFNWGELFMTLVLVVVWVCLALVVKQIQAEVELMSYLKIVIKILALPILCLVGHVIFNACRSLFSRLRNLCFRANWRLIKSYSLIGIVPVIMIGCGYYVRVAFDTSQVENIVQPKIKRKPATKKQVIVSSKVEQKFSPKKTVAESHFYQWPVPKKPVVVETKTYQKPVLKKPVVVELKILQLPNVSSVVAKVSKPSKPSRGKRVKKIVRNSTYDSYVVNACAKYGVDVELVRAMIHIESRGNKNAVSPAGAGGVMQLMPATALQYGVYNVHDPRSNIDGGVQYVKYLLDLFGNDYRLAMAGYNAGEGNVVKWKGVPPFEETRQYVRDVMAIYKALVRKHQVVSNG